MIRRSRRKLSIQESESFAERFAYNARRNAPMSPSEEQSILRRIAPLKANPIRISINRSGTAVDYCLRRFFGGVIFLKGFLWAIFQIIKRMF